MNEKLTIKQVSECLNKSRQTIMQWINEGKFKNAEKDNGLTSWWLVPVEDVEIIRQQMIADYQAAIEAISKHSSEWLK